MPPDPPRGQDTSCLQRLLSNFQLLLQNLLKTLVHITAYLINKDMLQIKRKLLKIPTSKRQLKPVAVYRHEELNNVVTKHKSILFIII